MPTTRSRSTSSSRRKSRPWHLGNTTVRSPFRLASALRVLSGSRYNGQLADAAAEAGLGRLLFDEGLLRSVSEGKTGAWNGRKWRSAMYQLGFITPAITRRLAPGQSDLAILRAAAGLPGIRGLQYEVTPNGTRLANSTSIVQMEDCFLRAILAYRVPSPIEGTHDGEPFSPLRVTLKAILALERTGLRGAISFEEMASLTQFCKSEADVPRLVGDIAAYRAGRAAARNGRKFDQEFRERAQIEHGVPVKSESLDDYADVNFRYLRATGLVTRTKAAIGITEEKRREIGLIVSQPDMWPGDDRYLRRLWDGAGLPTDDAGEATLAIRELERELREAGREPQVPSAEQLEPADVEQVRLKLEVERRILREEQFATAQRSDVGAIGDFLALMDSKSERSAAYKGEAPAYLEWAVWRSFLAIDTLVNQPWQVRQFHVDAAMNPLSPASSRKPDIICEFADYVLVVEVTFTENSRQEAAEGEPVRRHVAEATRRYHGKDVYGLFIAPRIDTNTAETFGRGSFVLSNERIALNIVPVTLAQFTSMFRAGFEGPQGIGPDDVRHFLEAALVRRSTDGEGWKTAIADVIRGFLTSLVSPEASV